MNEEAELYVSLVWHVFDTRNVLFQWHVLPELIGLNTDSFSSCVAVQM